MFTHDDRELLRQIAAHVDALRHQQHKILTRLLAIEVADDRILAELILLRQSEEAMFKILEELATAEEAEAHQLDYITVTLTAQ